MSAKSKNDAIREEAKFKFLRIKFNENNSEQNNLLLMIFVISHTTFTYGMFARPIF